MSENTSEGRTRVISNEDYFAEVQRILREGKEVRIRVKGGRESLALASNILAKRRLVPYPFVSPHCC
ncbi:hypothetical protein [Sphingobacterium sp. G1-14]|uniref:hypothetical protein n=1 Tax=Sphingobacterium sp. G1-14 TaxID=2003121 RepID=UPI000B48E69F|nr:hypothetical protein [Sphingobacterium sp. G1-14]